MKKTIRIAMNDELIAKLDRAVREAGTTRSAFMSQVLREAVERPESIEHRLRELRERGVLSFPPNEAKPEMKPLANRPGALQRFLKSRE
jgi:metal-responsive CopG/Arc/MetJ family transcriptional regulator